MYSFRFHIKAHYGLFNILLFVLLVSTILIINTIDQLYKQHAICNWCNFKMQPYNW
jgi:hypothetical protein